MNHKSRTEGTVAEGVADVHIPGLLNLHQQCLLSLNFLQGTVDYWQNALPYFSIRFDEPGARLLHNHWDQSENIGRSLYATLLARVVCGITEELPVEKCWKQLIHQSIPEGEGLSYRPNPSPYDIIPEARDAPAEQVAIAEEPILQADFWDNRSVFTGLLLSYEITGDTLAFAAARRMADQLLRLANWEGDCAFFRLMAVPLGWDPASAKDPPVMGQHMGGWVSPLVHFFQLTGDEQALQLARGLGLSFVRTYPDTVLATAQELDPVLGMNSHSLLFLLAGLVRLHRQTGEQEYLDWARWQFDAILQHQCSEFGWTAEFMPFQLRHRGGDSCETCSLADRIDTGIQLALAGFPSYWNDVQRCALNYLVEAQLRDVSWMPLARGLQESFYLSAYHVPDRSLGAYVGWGAPNDFVDVNSRAPGRIQNCCGAHGVFACHQLWRHAVQKTESGIDVHLNISCNTPWCSVLTHAPIQGCLEVFLKINALLRVRLPDWVDRTQIHAVLSGQGDQAFDVQGEYIVLSGLAGTTVTITYPMRRESRKETIGGQCYDVLWVDDYVTSIDPGGKILPLFQRDLGAVKETYDREVAWPARIDAIEW